MYCDSIIVLFISYRILSGWWLNRPYEKYEFVSWGLLSQVNGKINFMFQSPPTRIHIYIYLSLIIVYNPKLFFENHHHVPLRTPNVASGVAASQKSSAKISGMVLEEKSLEHLEAKQTSGSYGYKWLYQPIEFSHEIYQVYGYMVFVLA